MTHGLPSSAQRHVGDIGNIESTTSLGITTISLIDSVISLEEGNTANIMNRVIAIKQKPDTGSPTQHHNFISCGIIKPCNFTCQQLFDF